MRLNRTKAETPLDFQGGRILRPTGKKDRHSKVCTAKGPRDRRVRLSANTAIRFYDVQDRLGCDRPSKAIDWLMKQAKAAIDALNSTTTIGYETEENMEKQSPNYTVYKTEENRVFSNPEFGIQNQQHFNYNPTNSFSFFSMNDFQNNLNEPNSRTRSRAQDISFSLQSIQRDSILQHNLSPISSSDQQGLFSSSIPLEFDATPDMNWFQGMVNSNSNSNSGNGKGSGDGNIESFLGQNQFISQREPLQSSFSPSIRIPAFSSSSLADIGLGNDGFSGFSILPRIQGQEVDNSACNKLHSASSVLHYQDLQNH